MPRISKYRSDIQSLRGLAILAVLIFHGFPNARSAGFLGVDVFFVISGYLITPQITKILSISESFISFKNNLLHFYSRRFLRLAPAAIVVLFVSNILVFLLGMQIDLERFSRQGIASSLSIGNLGAFRYSGNYFSLNPNPLVHTWSLACEEQIYFFFPIILMILVFRAADKKKSIKKVIAALTVLSLSSVIFPRLLHGFYSLLGTNYLGADFSFYSPVSRFWQFSLGGFISMFQFKKIETRLYQRKRLKITLTLMLLFTLVFRLPINLNFLSLAISILAALSIRIGLVNVFPEFFSRILAWLGDRSYSIYLIHMPLLYLAQYSPVFVPTDRSTTIVQSTVAIAASIWLGNISYTYIENRFRVEVLPNGGDISVNRRNLFLILMANFILIFSFFCSQAIPANNINADPGLPIPAKISPWEWNSSCRLISTSNQIATKPCQLGSAKAKKSILLIGDSHAATSSKMISTLALSLKYKLTVTTFSGCGFVTKLPSPRFNRDFTSLTSQCLQHNRKILQVVRNTNPSLIILAMRNSRIYVKGNSKFERTNYNKLVLASFLKLKSPARSLIIIGSVPEYMPVQTYFQRMFGAKGKFGSVSDEDNLFWLKHSNSNYRYLNSVKIFCPYGRCHNKSGNIWLYHDDNHLSLRGTEKLKFGLRKLMLGLEDQYP